MTTGPEEIAVLAFGTALALGIWWDLNVLEIPKDVWQLIKDTFRKSNRNS